MSPRLEARLEQPGYFPGDTVRGRVEVFEGGKSKQLTVELSNVEQSRDYTEQNALVGPVTLHTGDLSAGMVHEFALALPQDALPSLSSSVGSLSWELRIRSHERGFDTRAHHPVAVQARPREESSALRQQSAPPPAAPPAPLAVPSTAWRGRLLAIVALLVLAALAAFAVPRALTFNEPVFPEDEVFLQELRTEFADEPWIERIVEVRTEIPHPGDAIVTIDLPPDESSLDTAREICDDIYAYTSELGDVSIDIDAHVPITKREIKGLRTGEVSVSSVGDERLWSCDDSGSRAGFGF